MLIQITLEGWQYICKCEIQLYKTSKTNTILQSIINKLKFLKISKGKLRLNTM